MIQVNFSGYNKYVTDSLYQWDLNQELTIHNLGVDVAPVIVFANRNISKGIVVQSKLKNGVITCAIPNALLQFSCDITAHLCDQNNKEYKAYECIKIPVIARVEPADYLYTDNVPIVTYESLIAEIGSVEANTRGEVKKLDDIKANRSELSELKTEIENTIDGEIIKVEDEISAERARIDQLLQLSEGSTTGDAELMDLRIGANGETYESAGSAVRSQVQELDAKINDNVVQLSEEKIGYKGYIGEAIDFNTLVEPGIFNVVNDVIASCTNYPSDVGGVITIKKRIGYDFPITQVLLDNKNNYYTRFKTSTTWTEWKSYASKEEVEKMSSDCYSFKGYVNEPIDINTLVTVGVFQIMDSIISTCTNYPSVYPGFLSVKANPTGKVLIQELVDSKGNLFIRYKTSTTWGAWNKYSIEYEIESHTDGVGALVEVAETYFNVAYDPKDRLVYDSTHGLYNSQITDGNGLKAIVCSQFEQACIAGITYENSRYVESKNSPLPWGFVSDGTGEYSYTDWDANNDYMKACHQAKYFEDHGLLRTFDVNRNGLKPGDLLFYTSDVVNGKVITDPPYYKKITHVGICLGADKDRLTYMHSTDGHFRLAERVFDPETNQVIGGLETGVSVKTTRYTTESPSYYVHSPIMAGYTTKKLAEISLSKNKTYTDKSAFIGEFVLEAPLPRGFYTIQFNDKGDSLGYIVVTYQNGDTELEVNYTAIKNANINSIVFYAEMPITKIYMRVSDGSYYNSTWAKLYKGYHM